MKPGLACAFLALLITAGCSRDHGTSETLNQFRLDGEVVRVDASRQTATIRHGKIEGWMEAMTMDYPVRDKQDFAKLRVGEHIQARVLQRPSDFEFWIDEIRESGAPETKAAP